MVLFNLNALSLLFEDITIKKMFFIPENVKLDLFSHAVLTSAGLKMASKGQNRLIDPKDGHTCPSLAGTPSLSERFSEQLAQFPLDEADCLGAGEIPSFFPPVVLYVKIERGVGHAKAIFFQEPAQFNYELLSAVGVKFVSGEWHKKEYLAHFTVDLTKHISSGTISDFAKTGYCNAFFLQHGTIGPTLEAGLTGAANDRIARARELGFKAVEKLGKLALKKPLQMSCQPPPPKQPFPFGDLVPLGFLLRCLNIAPGTPALGVRNELKHSLLAKRQGNLWSFQSGDIPTSTDSALVLLGVQDPESIQSLEEFSDGSGGYIPQLWSVERQPGKMVVGDFNRHWCESDFATTCLVRALRRDSRLPPYTSIDYLDRGFQTRSSLFFANPYLVDWTLAMAIAGDDEAEHLQERLKREILTSMNPDYSFGKFDIALSSALGILSLALLGQRDRTLLLAQARLSELMSPDGTWPVSIPFYSTLKMPDFPLGSPSQAETHVDSQQQIVWVGSSYYIITFYIDQYQMISTSLATLALSEEITSTKQEDDGSVTGVRADHPHSCLSQAEYIEAHALPPYVQNVPELR